MSKTEKKNIVVSQKDMTSNISKTRSSLNTKIDLIIAGSIDAQKLSIEGMVEIYNALKSKIVLTSPKEKKHTALMDYFKKDVCNTVLGQSWEYFTKSNINKKDLEKLSSEEQFKANENKIYKVGTLKGRTFLNFCKGGFFLYELNALYRSVADKNGQLLIKMEAVRNLQKEKKQSFWDSKINNTDYAFFSYNDMIRAYLTLFGVVRDSKDKSPLWNMIQSLMNYINEANDEKKLELFISKNYDVFIADELNNNKTKIYQLIESLLDIYIYRTEQTTKGQGNKVKYDIVSENLFVEYKKLNNDLEERSPIKKAS